MNMKEKINDNSSKTPGGISKSLLTPCRRVGLSRKWKGASPSFVSPLAGGQANIVEVKHEKKESRKRKTRILDEEIEDSEEKPCTPVNEDEHNLETEEADLSRKYDKSACVDTPVRHVEVLARKKSKLVANLRKKSSKENLQENVIQEKSTRDSEKERKEDEISTFEVKNKSPEKVSTLIRSKSKSRSKKTKSPIQNKLEKADISILKDIQEDFTIPIQDTECVNSSHIENSKQKSPNELTKECIVVIQKKIFKIDKNKTKVSENCKVSQTLFDSDTDDVPLSHLNKRDHKVNDDNLPPNPILGNCKTLESNKLHSDIITIDDDSDFIQTPKEENKIKPKTKQKKEFKNKVVPKKMNNIETKSQNSSFDDDDDFDFGNKKTILIRKAYEKPSKPLKAKSTGSITQRDIDDLKARIETKKKLLLAKAMCKDTEELRGLIKKWQKGCQDAFMELMELMKNKFPDRQNMNYSEMMQMLKIPPALVGYDSENEIFNTPDDASIILSKFDDL